MKAGQQKIYGEGIVNGAVHFGRSKSPLRRRHGLSPYSTLNTREGSWQSRKRDWLRTLKIQSDIGRDDALTYNIPVTLTDGRTGRKIQNQTSIFDPVLCELLYHWYCPHHVKERPGVVVDPFAGGSVRGIVASFMGLEYWGCDLSANQIAANRLQLDWIEDETPPTWVVGDSLVEVCNAPAADFLFSCPPYGNLEKYSDDPADISNMTYEQFLEVYTEIIITAARRLRPNRYACFVVGNFRDPSTGFMYDFVGDTVRAFQKAGLEFFNDGILCNAIGSGAMRANGSFLRGKGKLVKLHQNFLVFVKGDPDKAWRNIEKANKIASAEDL